MSATPQCPHCGNFNRFSDKYCWNCGGPLGTTSQGKIFWPNPWSISSSPQSYQYAALSRDLQRRGDIDKTKIGLLLLIIGAILSPIPYLNILASIIVLVGAVLVIIGRKSFGDVHSRNTIVSVIIYIVGASTILLGAIGFVLAGISATTAANASGIFNPAAFSQSLGDSFQAFLITTAIGGAIIGVAQVLFTYALQNQAGKALLWLGYLSSIGVAILELVIILPLISGAVSESFVGGVYSPAAFASLQTQLFLLGLVGFIPAIFYASGFYIARSRIERNEIPELRPVQGSSVGSLFDDSRYLVLLFVKVMLPIALLGLFGLVVTMLYHY